jgi:predicted GNAT family acetyltransferase
VLRADDPQVAELLTAGRRIRARSWGSALTDPDAAELALLASAAPSGVALRRLESTDLLAVLALDAATADDYPGDVATSHTLLTAQTAALSPTRRAFGALDTATGYLAAMTYVDIDGDSAEIDFTVVAGDRRGRGLGTALKAHALAELVTAGIRSFRTGGASENAAIRAVNTHLGFVVDEEWVTLR